MINNGLEKNFNQNIFMLYSFSAEAIQTSWTSFRFGPHMEEDSQIFEWKTREE